MVVETNGLEVLGVVAAKQIDLATPPLSGQTSNTD